MLGLRLLEKLKKTPRCASRFHDGFVVGCVDGTVLVYGSDCKLKASTEIGAPIYSIAAYGDNVYCGSQSIVCLEDRNGSLDPVGVYEGHSKNVSSMKIVGDRLLTGSWDATAKAWDLPNMDVKLTLSGHAHAVTTALHEDGRMVTGSQDGIIRIWSKEGALVHHKKVHEDLVREVAIQGDMIRSCSNDGTVAWSLLQDISEVFRTPTYSSFIYSCAGLTSDTVIYGGESRFLDVWDVKNSRLVQRIPQNAPVWQVLAVGPDVVCCSEDGWLSVWSPNQDTWLPADIRSQQILDANAGICEFIQRTATPNNELLDITKAETTPGIVIDDMRLMVEDDHVVGMLWDGSIWTRLGKAGASIPTMHEYAGDAVFPAGLYDRLFDIELGDGVLRKLPFKNSGSIRTAAADFCKREQIPLNHVPEIVEFIEKSTGLKASPPRSESRPPLEAPLLKQQYFPRGPVIVFEKPKDSILELMHNKIKQISDTMGTDCLSVAELMELDTLFSVLLKDTWMRIDFRPATLELVYQNLQRLSTENQFVLMDLWRITILHPTSAQLFKSSNHGWPYLAFAMKVVCKSDENGAAVGLKFLSNMCSLQTNTAAMMTWGSRIVSLLSQWTSETPIPKKAVLPYVTFLLNLSISLYHTQNKDAALASMIVDMCTALPPSSEDSTHRAVQAVGTLKTLHPDLDVRSFIESVKDPQDGNLKASLNELLALIR